MNIMKTTNSEFNLNLIIEAKRDQKILFKISNELLGRNQKRILPNLDEHSYAYQIAKYFETKVSTIINYLPVNVLCYVFPPSSQIFDRFDKLIR